MERFHTNMMYIKKFLNQGLFFKGMGFATTTRLQVACACSWVIYADKSGQRCCCPAAEDYHESEWALRHDFREKMKMSIFDRVMKSTNVSLCAFIAPQAKERCICSWTRYTNLLTWFNNFKVFLIEFGFAVVGCNEYPAFDETMMHQILNLDVMDISVGRSKTIVGGRPEVSFHDPHLPMPSLTSAKSLHRSLAFLEVTPQDSVCLCTGSYHWARQQKKGRGFASSSCTTCSTHVAGLDVRSRGNGRAPLG
jgi:hypothetical protein